ncbi:MAG: GTPase Era [Gammaproteobacteria bacterium]
MTDGFRCGHVAILGRPNVGKSTLLNRIVGQKLSITSSKPRTTRWHLIGIKTTAESQVIYVDTPGLQNSYYDGLNRHMRREAINSMLYVDVIVFMVEALQWTEMDAQVLKMIGETKFPLLLVINKIDNIRNKSDLLPFIKRMYARRHFTQVLPVSARTGDNLDAFERTVLSLLPEAQAEFPEDQLTDRNERFFAAEFIREKLTRKMGKEIPYKISVTIDLFVLKGEVLHIHAIIWVANESQKKIIIGSDGAVLKKAGEQARKDMEAMFGHRVFLQTWVKTKKKWSEDIKALQQLGYER